MIRSRALVCFYFILSLFLAYNGNAQSEKNTSGSSSSLLSSLRVIKPAITEYKVAYLASDSVVYGFYNNVMTAFNTNNNKVVDVAAMFNTVQMLDVNGYIWSTQVYTSATFRYDTTASGAPFNNNISINGYFHTLTSIRSDSSLWYLGGDDYNLFGNNNGSANLAPVQISPAGMKVKKVAMGARLIVLTTNGQVWEWTKGGGLTPVQKVLVRPAIDIACQHYDVNYAIIPDAGSPQTSGFPYVWGGWVYGFWGGNTPYAEPTSVKTLWGMTIPIKKIASNGNTTHYIDTLGRLFGIGDNAQAEIGNGYELVNKSDIYATPYGWSWQPGEALTGAPPQQIAAGTTWKDIFACNTFSYYKYAVDSNDSLYSWGRNKSLVLGNGFYNMQEATYPNAMDVLVPKIVHPLTAVYQPYNFSLPTIDAGPNQTITANTVNLSGSAVPARLVKATPVAANGIDTIGYSIASYQWTKASGPACTIVSPGSASTAVNGLIPGVYVFKLRMTDSNTGTISDSVIITVNVSGNQLPLANAGPDKLITLPLNTVTLTGSGTDPDGTIAAYSWGKISGPSQFTIVSPLQAVTVISNLAQGTYQFELTVTDNQGSIAKDTVAVTVNPAPNQAPTANAGADKTITLPTNTVTLAGSGTDPDGTISAYQWTKIAGPATYTIVSPTAASTVINNLVQGTYQFELKVTDNAGATGKDTVVVTVNPAPNQAPVANAGADKSITLPTNTVTLNGSGTDADGTIATYAWTKVSGPATYTIVSPAAATTAINGLVQGVYVFRLTVTDNQGATGFDDVQVTVNAANIAPTANAGADQTIQLPTSTVTLTGSGADADGTISTYAWTKLTGPATYTIVSPAAATTVINGLVQGVYVFRLTVTDNNGATGYDDVQITVNAANIAPTANAGADKTITLPTNTVTLTGFGTDPDGTIAAYQWTKIAGPATYTIVTPAQGQTIINNLVQGVYLFELMVTDNQGATGKDTVYVTVNPANNIAPTANAGADQIVLLPINFVTLNGSGTDPDGTITGYLWNKVAGPAGCSIINAGSASTSVTGLVQGTYQFELTVTDNSGAIARDTMIVTVNPLPNRPPTANAGADQTITLPVNTVTVNGSGADTDGTIASYFWTRISGPATYNIVNASSATTVINNLVQGVYQFELKVIDNSGAPARDTIQITVLANSNQPPVANAGLDQNIMLPVNSVRLNGSGTDADGTISTYLWTKVSGPATYSIATPGAAVTDIINLVQGVYQFALTVTDNSGATASDTVYVTVNPATQLPNVPPSVQAGNNQSITLPVSYVTTQAAASDPDGIITTYQWTKINGPLVYTIVSPNQAQTEIRDLIPGHYSFELKVTDNRGAVSRDTMTVDVADAPMVYGSVFPSPATTKVNVSINAAVTNDKTIITIFDIHGQPMVREEFTRSSQNTVRQYDVTRWAKGYYLVEIRLTEINREVKRFVVQ